MLINVHTYATEDAEGFGLKVAEADRIARNAGLMLAKHVTWLDKASNITIDLRPFGGPGPDTIAAHVAAYNVAPNATRKRTIGVAIIARMMDVLGMLEKAERREDGSEPVSEERSAARKARRAAVEADAAKVSA